MQPSSAPPDGRQQNAAKAGPWTGLAARVKRAALIAGMAAATLNIFTGSPLAALWLGSRVAGTSGSVTMTPVAVVAVSLCAFSIGLFKLLRLLGSAYDRATGRRSQTRAHTPWLRSMRGERPFEAGAEYKMSALEIVLCVMVLVALVAFEYWFFFLSTSSIDQRSGRD